VFLTLLSKCKLHRVETGRHFFIQLIFLLLQVVAVLAWAVAVLVGIAPRLELLAAVGLLKVLYHFL
jgi:hypothetical protein